MTIMIITPWSACSLSYSPAQSPPPPPRQLRLARHVLTALDSLATERRNVPTDFPGPFWTLLLLRPRSQGTQGGGGISLRTALRSGGSRGAGQAGGGPPPQVRECAAQSVCVEHLLQARSSAYSASECIRSWPAASRDPRRPSHRHRVQCSGCPGCDCRPC
jgi:hypothetical protein